jgi:Chlorophyll A-B binding protein
MHMCFRISTLTIFETAIGLILLWTLTLAHSLILPITKSLRPTYVTVQTKLFSPIMHRRTKMAMVDDSATTDSSIAVQEKPFNSTNDIGIIAPTGFWDPLNLSENIDTKTYTQYRTAEIKHGRAAMLCVIGYIVPEIYKFPGDIAPGISFQSIPNGVAAIDAIPSLGWMQIIFLIGAVDYYGYLGSYTFGQAPALTPEVLYQRQQSELTHGRLAMLASMELLRHDAQNYIIPNYDGLGDHLITGLPFLYT